MRTRRVVPELLDSLPPEDPSARRSRRDLRLINFLMGSHRWFLARMASLPPGLRVLELGPGDAALTRLIAPAVLAGGGSYTAADLAPAPAGLPSGVRWLQGDLRAPEAWEKPDVLIANLILHHFEDRDLREIGRRASACSHILAHEPSRRKRHLASFALLAPFVGTVTRHDARVSIRAGFRGGELAALLGLARPEWRLSHRDCTLGAHRLQAHRAATLLPPR